MTGSTLPSVSWVPSGGGGGGVCRWVHETLGQFQRKKVNLRPCCRQICKNRYPVLENMTHHGTEMACLRNITRNSRYHKRSLDFVCGLEINQQGERSFVAIYLIVIIGILGKNQPCSRVKPKVKAHLHRRFLSQQLNATQCNFCGAEVATSCDFIAILVQFVSVNVSTRQLLKQKLCAC